MGRRISRVVRRAVRGVTRGLDAVTGDILDLDGSKQKEQIEAMRKAEEQAQREAEAKRRAEQKYQQDVAGAKDKFMQDEMISPDSTGVGLGDVQVDFTKKIGNTDDEDDLKKMLRRY